jgi:hypothetical protein
MILDVEMETFKLLVHAGTSPVYMLEGQEKITYYTAKPPMIIKTVYHVKVDEETGIPKTEDLAMQRTSFFTDAIPILGAKEESSVRMTVTQG